MERQVTRGNKRQSSNADAAGSCGAACWVPPLVPLRRPVADRGLEVPVLVVRPEGRFTMEFAQSGPDALQRISGATDVSFILILSDINMPGMSGLELLPRARALRPDVPVIMITTYEGAETKRKARENGAQALLTKPIDFVTLRNEIDLCGERAA